eukprot:203673_1
MANYHRIHQGMMYHLVFNDHQAFHLVFDIQMANYHRIDHRMMLERYILMFCIENASYYIDNAEKYVRNTGIAKRKIAGALACQDAADDEDEMSNNSEDLEDEDFEIEEDSEEDSEEEEAMDKEHELSYNSEDSELEIVEEIDASNLETFAYGGDLTGDGRDVEQWNVSQFLADDNADDNLICKENRKESKMRPMRRKRKRMNQYLESSDGYSTDNALNTNNAHVLKRKRRRLNVTRNVTRNVPKQKMKNQWKKKENKIRDQRNRIEELEAKMDQLLSEKKKRYYKKKGAQKKRRNRLFI